MATLEQWGQRARECRNPALLFAGWRCDQARLTLLHQLTQCQISEIDSYIKEIESDTSFLTEITTQLAKWTNYQPRAVDFMLTGKWGSIFFTPVTLYALIRILRPKIMIETGGTPGKSTAFLLRAMEKNQVGQLYTIDLPPQTAELSALPQHTKYHELRPSGTASNWVVPEHLRHHQTLLQGKSTEHLPQLLQKLNNPVDIFFHDSDHSYENMLWEFETAKPYVKGIIASDDILTNDSFSDFCTKHQLKAHSIFSFGITLVN